MRQWALPNWLLQGFGKLILFLQIPIPPTSGCFTCVTTPQSTYFGKVMISTPCRWCPATQECHAYGSLFDSCSIPIHTSDVEDTDYANYVCEAAKYPHIASDFSNTDIDALEQWVIQYLDNFKGKKHVFPSYDGTGDTGVYEIPDKVSIAVASDWGSGTIESAAVASLMGMVSAKRLSCEFIEASYLHCDSY